MQLSNFLATLTVAAGCLLPCGAALAQQGSFAVMITLRTPLAQTLDPAQLCNPARQPSRLDPSVRVDCSQLAGSQATALTLGGATATPGDRPREVFVTF
ncbi:MAG TPA: hypothetical protein VLJ58_09590 [Ramlibacter sp.]|nr:hypothetical protein [Ramlibacter sp.]